MTTQDPELSAALGWPGGISDPVLDRKTLLQQVAALCAALAQQDEPAQAISECIAVLRPMVKGKFPHEQALDELVGYTASPQRVALQTEPAEPVGWNWMLDGQPYGQAYYGNPPDTDIAERAAIAGRTVRLLYTAPPQRQPLTDATLWGMWVDSPSDVLRFARAVERAHGIKE